MFEEEGEIYIIMPPLVTRRFDFATNQTGSDERACLGHLKGPSLAPNSDPSLSFSPGLELWKVDGHQFAIAITSTWRVR